MSRAFAATDRALGVDLLAEHGGDPGDDAARPCRDAAPVTQPVTAVEAGRRGGDEIGRKLRQVADAQRRGPLD